MKKSKIRRGYEDTAEKPSFPDPRITRHKAPL